MEGGEGDVEAHTRRWNLKIARVYKESIETGDGIGALHDYIN